MTLGKILNLLILLCPHLENGFMKDPSHRVVLRIK